MDTQQGSGQRVFSLYTNPQASNMGGTRRYEQQDLALEYKEGMMNTAKPWLEQDVTLENMMGLLSQSDVKFTVADEETLNLDIDGASVYFEVDQDKKMIKFIAFAKINAFAPYEQKHDLVNALNDSYVLTRFSLSRKNPERMMADYFIPFTGGIVPLQVLTSLHIFTRVLVWGIQKEDKHDLLV
jgi:hypothetical protein